MSASPTRKPRPSYSLSHATIERLARLAADTAARRGTKHNATAMLEELVLAEVRRRKMPDDGAGGPGVVAARKGRGR